MKTIWPTVAIISAIIIEVHCTKQPCNYFTSAKLINGSYSGHTFDESEKFITENGEERGCMCINGRRCVRKCCPLGMVHKISINQCVKAPSRNNTDLLPLFEDDIRPNDFLLFGKMDCYKKNNETRLLVHPAIQRFNLHEVRSDSVKK